MEKNKTIIDALFFIGFKLAFNYLKAKRYIDAINVCHKVKHNIDAYKTADEWLYLGMF